MNDNENNFIRISHLSFKNNSIQANLSKDFSLFKPKSKEKIFNKNIKITNNTYINCNKNDNIKININKNININNIHPSSSACSAREQSFEGLKDKLLSSGFRTSYSNCNSTKNKTSFKVIKYCPKRVINFSNLKCNLPKNKLFYGRGFFDFEKSFNKIKLDKKKIGSAYNSTYNLLPSSTSETKINFDVFNQENIINNKDLTNFKTSQISYFSKTSNNYTNLKKFLPYMSERNKVRIDSFISQLVNIIQSQKNILFVENDDYNYFSSSCREPNKNSCLYLEERKDKTLFNNKVMYKFLNINTEYNMLVNKLFDIVFNEIKNIKEKNKELKKTNFENGILLSHKKKELNEIEKYININQAKNLIQNNKSKEEKMNDLNMKFRKKENEYLININKLNQEMKDLLLLLNKSKEYYNKYKEIEKSQKINNREINSLKHHMINEFTKKNEEFLSEKEVNKELNERIINLEETINKIKIENEDIKLHGVEVSSQIKKLYMIINERNENIKMLNEELNFYYIKYIKEKKENENTKILLNHYKKDNNKL